MKILDFSTVKSTGNITYDILLALRKCKEEKYEKLVFPKGDYNIDTTYCEERVLCVSNHDLNAAKRIALLVEDMENFEIEEYKLEVRLVDDEKKRSDLLYSFDLENISNELHGRTK